MPIIGIPLKDDELFHVLMGVVPAHLLLMFAPTWKYTPTVSLMVACFYSFMYLALLPGLPEQPTGGGFGTLDEVATLFRVRENVFLGWVHYIAFDLMVNRSIVADAHVNKIPHIIGACCIPFTFLVGPVGLLLYYAAKSAYIVFFESAGRKKAPGKNRKM